MKVAYITAGAAGMYCGSCMRDNTLVRTLQNRGVDATLIPTYTPIRTDEEDVSMNKVFLGGINVYLQQKYPIFNKLPRFLEKALERPWLLKLVSRFGSSTDAQFLGDLTVGVLEGDDGPLRKEMRKLLEWMKEDFKPDLVHLTNAMFLGVASMIKEELDVPVLCGLPGEDLFLDALEEPFRSRSFEILWQRARDVDGFTAPSMYYGDYMTEYLKTTPDKMHYVPLGLDLKDHGQGTGPKEDGPFVIGFLGRRAPEKGLHNLVDAFKIVADKLGKDKVQLRIAGFLSPKDKDYYEDQCTKLARWGLRESVIYDGEVDRAAKLDFYNQIHAFSMPAAYKEPKGLSLLEAMANGVPVVQPDHGAFSETVQQTGGGLLVTSEDPQAVAEGLIKLAQDPTLRKQLGAKGKTAVHRDFTAERMADKTMEVFEYYVHGKPIPQESSQEQELKQVV